MQQKIVFVIPGFRHKPTQKGYVELKKMLKLEGFRVVLVTIPWNASTILENTSFFLRQYRKILTKYEISSQNAYLLGFSYGALIAFLAATKISVNGLILCSLSPFFKEDLPTTLPKNVSSLQEKRFLAFSKLGAQGLAKKVKAKNVMMLYGANESIRLIKRSQNAFNAMKPKNKYLFSIQKTHHDISDKKYVNAIHFATSFL